VDVNGCRQKQRRGFPACRRSFADFRPTLWPPITTLLAYPLRSGDSPRELHMWASSRWGGIFCSPEALDPATQSLLKCISCFSDMVNVF
jgi:hypothetical protein